MQFLSKAKKEIIQTFWWCSHYHINAYCILILRLIIQHLLQ